MNNHTKEFYITQIELYKKKIDNINDITDGRVQKLKDRISAYKNPGCATVLALAASIDKWNYKRDRLIESYEAVIKDALEQLDAAVSIKDKKKIYYENNKETIKKATARWLSEHPEYTKDWFREHKEQNHERNKKYYRENRERLLLAQRERNKNQVECNKAKKLCKELAGYTCKLCGSKEEIDAHHIIPLPLGTNEQDNLICLCRSCHQKVHRGDLKIEK